MINLIQSENAAPYYHGVEILVLIRVGIHNYLANLVRTSPYQYTRSYHLQSRVQSQNLG